MKLFDGHTSANKRQALLIAQAIYGGQIVNNTLTSGPEGATFVGAFTGGDPMFSNPYSHFEDDDFIPACILTVENAILFRGYKDTKSITVYNIQGSQLRDLWRKRQHKKARSIKWDHVSRESKARLRFRNSEALLERANLTWEEIQCG